MTKCRPKEVVGRKGIYKIRNVLVKKMTEMLGSGGFKEASVVKKNEKKKHMVKKV